MQHDFSKVQEVVSLVVPEGIYLCRVGEVVESRSRDGSEQWRFRLEAADGDRIGRTLAWDSITWSDRGVYRVKKVLESFGFDVSGVLSVEASELRGRYVLAELRKEVWENPTTGETSERMTVPYLGYEPAESPEGGDSWAGSAGVGSSGGTSAVGEGGPVEEEQAFETPF